jgi:hypothetical protein
VVEFLLKNPVEQLRNVYWIGLNGQERLPRYQSYHSLTVPLVKIERDY